MADIKLGQSIAGTFTSADSKDTDGKYYDEYDFIGLDNYRQLTINIQRGAGNGGSTYINLINTATGAIVAENYNGGLTVSLANTVFPGIKYKLRVSGSNLGDYTVSSVDGGKATSIVGLSDPTASGRRYLSVGTVGANGAYFSLAGGSDNFPLFDLALSSNNQFYGVAPVSGSNTLYRIDPSIDIKSQVDYAGTSSSNSKIKDALGNLITGNINALEFSADNKLYGIAVLTTGDKFYQIDPTTKVATLIGNLPTGFISSGDLVYDAANSRFFATSKDTLTTDALWQIPIANPAGATKVGQIGFTAVSGLNFEGSQLTGFKNKEKASGGNKIIINPTTGVGTLGQEIFGANDIGGASTIFPSGDSGAVSWADLKKDPGKYMGSIRDYDGNNLGGSSSWKLLGDVDIQGDGDLESILVNPAIERFASVGSVNGNVDFSKHGLNGDTRVVGIYIDPTLKDKPENIGGPFDSQRRFQNDLKIDNLKVLAAGDYNNDGFQDLYFKLGDGSAVLRALMFKDGNIQYANYQSKTDLAAFMTANNVNNSVWGSWL